MESDSDSPFSIKYWTWFMEKTYIVLNLGLTLYLVWRSWAIDFKDLLTEFSHIRILFYIFYAVAALVYLLYFLMHHVKHTTSSIPRTISDRFLPSTLVAFIVTHFTLAASQIIVNFINNTF